MDVVCWQYFLPVNNSDDKLEVKYCSFMKNIIQLVIVLRFNTFFYILSHIFYTMLKIDTVADWCEIKPPQWHTLLSLALNICLHLDKTNSSGIEWGCIFSAEISNDEILLVNNKSLVTFYLNSVWSSCSFFPYIFNTVYLRTINGPNSLYLY